MIVTDSTTAPLLQQSADAFGPTYKSVLFDQYKGFVDSADKISARRATANSFMLSLNTTLASLAGFSASVKERPSWTVLTAVAGALLSVVWWQTIATYSALNAAKFTVILELEKELPAGPYGREWSIKTERTTLTGVERKVPIAFFVLYAGLIALVVFWNWARWKQKFLLP
jgi:hypothetical protein